MSRLTEIALATVRARGMLPEGAPVLALVSGGADSVAMLRLLAGGEFGRVELSALHVDHMLRGEASDADASFVVDLCASLRVECRVVRYDVSAYATEEGLNLEDAGRRVRYRFAEEGLDALCARVGAEPSAGRIAVAHTFDDRMETFLIRVATGAGAGGLASIRHTRGRVVRPLLDARRADVVDHLRGLGQAWREDATNADTSRLRARVRADLLPLLESVNPRFDEATMRTLLVLSDEDDLLESLCSERVSVLATCVPGAVRIERKGLLALPRAMQRRVLRSAVFGEFPDSSRLEHAHIEAVLDGAALDGFARDLPGGLRAFTEYGTLVVSRSGGEAWSLAPSLLDVPGTIDLGEAGSLRADPARPGEMESDPMTALVDAERIVAPLTVDSVRPGDRMRPLGMRGTRKISDILADAKVPRATRSAVPVVRSGDEIVWVAGVRQSDEHRVRSSTERTVRLSWTGPVRE